MNTTTFDLRTAILADGFADELRRLRATGELQSVLPELASLESSCKLHKDNVEHSIQVLENAKELSEDPEDAVLFVAALFHDVGKPKTFAFAVDEVAVLDEETGETTSVEVETKQVTFTNHDRVGANMARKFLRKYGFTKDEIAQITILIREHMRGHTFKVGWSDSAIRRLAAEAGSVRQIERLGIIFGSDATTKNEARRRRFRANAFELRDAMLAILEADALKARRPAIDGTRVMELTGLKPSRELGAIMKFLNSEEGLALSEAEATERAIALAKE